MYVFVHVGDCIILYSYICTAYTSLAVVCQSIRCLFPLRLMLDWGGGVRILLTQWRFSPTRDCLFVLVMLYCIHGLKGPIHFSSRAVSMNLASPAYTLSTHFVERNWR
jgi:hypothetical protein